MSNAQCRLFPHLMKLKPLTHFSYFSSLPVTELRPTFAISSPYFLRTKFGVSSQFIRDFANELRRYSELSAN